MFKALINVTLKDSILDPQGETIKEALEKLSFPANRVRIGKHIEITLNASSKSDAENRVDQMCKKLLYNPEIEQYSFQIVEM